MDGRSNIEMDVSVASPHFVVAENFEVTRFRWTGERSQGNFFNNSILKRRNIALLI